MFSRITTTLVGIFLMFLSMTQVHAQSLQDVIDKYCRKDCISAQTLSEVTSKIARSYGIDQRAIIAIVHIESKYHIKAKNGSSVGLSQVLLRYHKGKFRGKNFFDPEDNLFAGMKVFSDCLKKTKGNYNRAFGCYNGGGDKNYRTKAANALAMVKRLELPSFNDDPLYEFLMKKKVM